MVLFFFFFFFFFLPFPFAVLPLSFPFYFVCKKIFLHIHYCFICYYYSSLLDFSFHQKEELLEESAIQLINHKMMLYLHTVQSVQSRVDTEWAIII